MNLPKKHILENGVEMFICNKCKIPHERLNGLKTKSATEKKAGHYKWLCNICYADVVQKN